MPIVKPTEAEIARAAAELKSGRLVAFPTETVYGLGADATNGHALARIFEAKGRPRFNPLIVHVADTAAAARIARVTGKAKQLAEAFWPGPLTLVLPRRPESGISELVSAGLDTIGVRVPSHPIAHALLQVAAVPVAAPSANVSGHVSPTTADHVDADLGTKVAMILDGSPTEHGLESTVVDATGERIVMLRPGATTREAIEAVLGEPFARRADADENDVSTAQPRSPGQLASHYAPHARVRLNATELRAGEVLPAFGTPPPHTEGRSENLSPSGDLIEAAANLFAALRRLDATGAETIAVMPVPATGLGEAINDRLRRAAAGR
jgi:L-threonylcarbamoyladenylate synthase